MEYADFVMTESQTAIIVPSLIMNLNAMHALGN